MYNPKSSLLCTTGAFHCTRCKKEDANRCTTRKVHSFAPQVHSIALDVKKKNSNGVERDERKMRPPQMHRKKEECKRCGARMQRSVQRMGPCGVLHAAAVGKCHSTPPFHFCETVWGILQIRCRPAGI